MQMMNEKLIKKWEKLKLKAYLPTKDDVWTIGWGHTYTTKRGDVITREQAEVLFKKDIAWATKAVNNSVNVGLTQHQFDALVSFVFNIGKGNFSRSTLLRKLNAGDYVGAAEQFSRWNKQRNKAGKLVVLRGLTRRRAEEAEYFQEGDMAEIDVVSTSPEEVKPLKPMFTSKELVGGVGASLTGLGTLFGSMSAEAQSTLSITLSTALLGFGIFFVWNRLRARKRGER